MPMGPAPRNCQAISGSGSDTWDQLVFGVMRPATVIAKAFKSSFQRDVHVDRARRVVTGEVLPPPEGETENDFDMKVLE